MYAIRSYYGILIPFVAGLLIYRSGWSDLTYSLIAASVLALLIALAAWLFMFPSLSTYRVKNIQGVITSYSIHYTKLYEVYLRVIRIATI